LFGPYGEDVGEEVAGRGVAGGVFLLVIDGAEGAVSEGGGT
jgi:hypothetical protein